MLFANVKSSPYNAVGDGTANDTTAINAALTAVIAANGGVVYFPVGEYKITTGLLPTGTNQIIFRGDGAGVSVIKMDTGVSNNSCIIVNDHGSKVIVEDLTLNAQNGANVNGLYSRAGLAIRRCEFLKNELASGIFLQGAMGADIDDCVFVSKFESATLGTRAPKGIQVIDGCDIRIRRPRLINQYNGIDLSGYVSRVMIVDPHAEGSHYLLPIRTKSTGGLMTGTATSWTADGGYVRLTAPAGSFPDPLFVASPYKTVDLRFMVQVGTATTSAAVGNHFYASGSPNFTTWGLVPGDLVRIGSTVFGVVQSVVSNTELVVEGWFDTVTLQPVSAPAGATTLTGYRVGTGGTFEVNTDTSVRTYPQWLNGTPITAAELTAFGASVTYEVLIDHGNYSGPQATNTVTDVTVIGGTYVRSWSDQVSLFGPRSLIVTPRIVAGQDTGVTVNGDHSIVVAPHVREQGQRGLFGNGADLLIFGGDFTRCPRRLEVGDDTYGSQVGMFGPRHTAIGVQVDGENLSKARVGFAWSMADALLIGCSSRQHYLASCTSFGVSASAQVFQSRFQDVTTADGTVGKIRHLSGAIAPTYVFRGTNAPKDTLEAANGSWYRQQFTTGVELIWFKANGQWKLSSSAFLRSPLT